MSDHEGRMNVRRVQDDRGSHIEPPINEEWDDLTTLRWLAGVVHADTGLDIRVNSGGLIVDGVPQDDCFNIVLGSSSASAFAFDSAWTYISGVSAGHRATHCQEQSR